MDVMVPHVPGMTQNCPAVKCNPQKNVSKKGQKNYEQ